MTAGSGGSTTANVSHPEDLDLVARARAGDSVAIDVLLVRMRFVRQVVLYKNSRLGGPLENNELEDVIQDALTAVWKKLGHYRGSGPLEAWLYRFSYYQICTRLRASQRMPVLLADVCGDTIEPEVRVPDDPTRFAYLYDALEQLDETTAEVIRLKSMESMTFDSISTRTGLPTNTAKTRYYRGLRRLRELVGKRAARDEARSGS